LMCVHDRFAYREHSFSRLGAGTNREQSHQSVKQPID
jgi:hypothetical protein